MIDAADVARRLAVIRARIDAVGGSEVQILAVTKGFDLDAVLAARSLGLHAVGENYAQELAAKVDALETAEAVATDEPAVPLEWHFIGQLQSKRVRLIADVVSVWQSVDRLKVGREIAKYAAGARVMVQVNATGEPQKAGCDPTEVPGLVESLNDLGLSVLGLMTIGRAGSEIDSRAGFRVVSELADSLGLVERSMGMSADLELAVEEGATMVRIGTGLFGARPVKRAK